MELMLRSANCRVRVDQEKQLLSILNTCIFSSVLCQDCTGVLSAITFPSHSEHFPTRCLTTPLLSCFEVENAFLLPKFRIVKTVLQIFGKRIEKYIKKKVENIKSMIYMEIQKHIFSYIKVTHFYLFAIFMICVNHTVFA